MVFDISWKTVAGLTLIAAATYFAIREIKKADEEKERIENVKKEAVGDRDITHEINEVSFENDVLETSEDKADAYKVMEDLYLKFKNAKTVDSFNNAFADYNNAYKALGDPNKESAKGKLIVLKDRYDKERAARAEERIRTYETRREDARNRTEVEKAKIISDALKSAGKYVFAGTQYTKGKAMSEAIDKLSGLSFTIN